MGRGFVNLLSLYLFQHLCSSLTSLPYARLVRFEQRNSRVRGWPAGGQGVAGNMACAVHLRHPQSPPGLPPCRALPVGTPAAATPPPSPLVPHDSTRWDTTTPRLPRPHPVWATARWAGAPVHDAQARTGVTRDRYCWFHCATLTRAGADFDAATTCATCNAATHAGSPQLYLAHSLAGSCLFPSGSPSAPACRVLLTHQLLPPGAPRVSHACLPGACHTATHFAVAYSLTQPLLLLILHLTTGDGRAVAHYRDAAFISVKPGSLRCVRHAVASERRAWRRQRDA